MRELSLFTGAGGGILGSKLLGWTTVGYVEWEPYCQRVIRQRIDDGIFDDAPIYGDIRAFNSEGYSESYKGLVDIITGGFPCQDISSAGTGKGLDGERSGFFFEMAKCISTIQPKYLFMENSPMLAIRGLDRVLYTIAEMGYNARWCTIGADAIGLPHHRARIWIFAYPSCIRRNFLDKNKKDRRANVFNESIKRSFGSSELPFRVGEFNNNPRSGVCRKDDGLAEGLVRLKAIGNGQVPITMAVAFRILSEGII